MNTSSEQQTVDEIIREEQIKASIQAEVDLLHEAETLYYDDKKLEHWRVLFFREQKLRANLENEVSRLQRENRSQVHHLRMAANTLRNINTYTIRLDEFIVNAKIVNSHPLAKQLLEIARVYLKDIMARVNLISPQVTRYEEPLEYDDIPF